MLSLGNRLALFAALSLALTINPAFAQSADSVLFNGRIVTVDGDFSVREALAIGHGEVLATAPMRRCGSSRATRPG